VSVRTPGRLPLFVVGVLLAAAPASGERLPVRTLTTADGFPRDQLACVHSDRRGFLWFCSGDGLVRFDGQRATTFGRDEGLRPAEVRSLLIARDGRFWTGATAGLFEFRTGATGGRPRFVPVPRDDGKPTGAIWGLAESHDGSIWCASGRGLLRLTRSGAGVELREVEIGLPRGSDDLQIVRAVLEDDERVLWVGTASGLYRRTPDGRTERLTTRDGLPVNEVRTLAATPGRLWAGTRDGLAVIDRGQGGRSGTVRRVFTARDGLPNSNVNALYADGGLLWIGTVAGVVEGRLAASDQLNVELAMTGFYAWGITADRYEDVWIATEAGARRLARLGFTTYLQEDGLTNTRVSSVFVTQHGEVCATTLVRTLRLSCFNGRRFDAIPIPAVDTMNPGWGWSQLTLQDRAGRWWLPTGEGLLQFPAGPVATLATAKPARRYSARTGLPSSDIFRLFEDSSGGIWLSTFAETGNGLARVDPQSGTARLFGERDGLPANLPLAHAFAQDGSGGIWIGCEFGLLLRYRDGRFEAVRIHEEQPRHAAMPVNEQLRSLLVDRRGRLWIGSALSGLGRIDDPASAAPRVTWLGSRQGLSSDTVWILAEHHAGELFVGTARGVDRVNPDTSYIAHYLAEEGVPRGEIWGAARDRHGDLWVATTAGLARLTPAEDDPPVPPVTVVTAVRVGGVAVDVAADGMTRVPPVSVRPGDRSVEIEFVSPGARGSDGLRYQHRLDGVSRDWMTTDSRTVTLAGIGPGSYRFLVRAAIGGGRVGEPAEVAFTVLAPVWRRSWFVSLAAAVVVALAVAFHRARMARLVEVERVRSRIAADLHDGVGASLSRIAIMSEVVRRRAEAVLPDAVPALASIADDARGLIDDMSDAVWSIDPRLDTLQQVIVRVRALASEIFDGQPVAWNVDGPDDAASVALAPEQRRHVYLILKEALTNVLRHARASHVAVRVAATRDRLHLAVVDDGRGVGGAPSTSRGGRGVESMRARAAALGGTLTVSSGAAGGTRVEVDVPLASPHGHAVGAAGRSL